MTTNAQAALAAGTAMAVATLERDAAAARVVGSSRGGYYTQSAPVHPTVLAERYLSWLDEQDAVQSEADKIKSKGTLEERVEKLEENK